MEIVAVILLLVVLVMIMLGYPVAFSLAGVSIIAGIFLVPDFLDFLPLRIMGIIQNYVLISVPLFIFMGLILEKTGIAEDLLRAMAALFGKFPGGMAISVVLVGGMLAASTGIVGATVITMGLISLPAMQRVGYHKGLSTGTIAASGTLGQIIPPSVVLVLLGSVLNVPVGDLFKGAVVPGILLVIFYIIYILIISFVRPEWAPPLEESEIAIIKQNNFALHLIKALFMPLILVVAVLGSIFMGIASPTEAAAVGAVGAMVLAGIKKKLNRQTLRLVMAETSGLTTMVFFILIGATAFALVFRGLGGDTLLTSFFSDGSISATHFLIILMLIVFVAGFFIDFIEIIFILVPVVAPVLMMYKLDLIWVGILLAVNLQTSFITPPFGFALFYLKGVTPPEIKTKDIYAGIIPFLCIQILVFVLVFVFPEIINII